ncbi:hypothetical protein QBC44DRAFT_336103 [Cladorrhinum sp. PSN332]|nr:hypothetical protein QBC44DRAFT_336103 [Cladorrhinum sp. PSN332]
MHSFPTSAVNSPPPPPQQQQQQQQQQLPFTYSEKITPENSSFVPEITCFVEYMLSAELVVQRPGKKTYDTYKAALPIAILPAPVPAVSDQKMQSVLAKRQVQTRLLLLPRGEEVSLWARMKNARGGSGRRASPPRLCSEVEVQTPGVIQLNSVEPVSSRVKSVLDSSGRSSDEVVAQGFSSETSQNLRWKVVELEMAKERVTLKGRRAVEVVGNHLQMEN